MLQDTYNSKKVNELSNRVNATCNTVDWTDTSLSEARSLRVDHFCKSQVEAIRQFGDSPGC